MSRIDPAALDEGGIERSLRQVEPGVVGDPAHVLGHRVGGQQMELEVLRRDRIVSITF